MLLKNLEWKFTTTFVTELKTTLAILPNSYKMEYSTTRRFELPSQACLPYSFAADGIRPTWRAHCTFWYASN